MTSGPIEKRLRECTEEDEAAAARAGTLLRALPSPPPLSEYARRRTLSALRASSRNGRTFHFTALQWAVLSILLVSTAAASAKRIFPNFLRRPPAPVESAADPLLRDPAPAVEIPASRAPSVIEVRPSQKAVIPAPFAKTRAPSPPKSEPLRPRLLSDPQRDDMSRVVPKNAHDGDAYSVLLDVCVSVEGSVTKVSVVRGRDPRLDGDIVEAIQHWNYLPAEADGKPVPMCFPLVYRIQVQRD